MTGTIKLVLTSLILAFCITGALQAASDNKQKQSEGWLSAYALDEEGMKTVQNTLAKAENIPGAALELLSQARTSFNAMLKEIDSAIAELKSNPESLQQVLQLTSMIMVAAVAVAGTSSFLSYKLLGLHGKEKIPALPGGIVSSSGDLYGDIV